MAGPTQPPVSKFVTAARKVYHPLGFQKGYNFVLFFIFAGAMMGFCLARFQFFDFENVFCSSGAGGTLPGECYWYRKELKYQIGIRLHLIAILPAGFLACFQFVPVIRHKLILFHRINGYVVVILSLAGTAGALMIARHAVGGGLDIQTAIGLLAIMTTGSLGLSYYNIKKLQIDQHRAWMLRAWFYFGTPITTRIILIIAVIIITKQKTYFTVSSCAKLEWFFNTREKTLSYYPECAPYFNGSEPYQQTVILAAFEPSSARPDQIGSVFTAAFGMALWLGIAIQAIGVEIYLQLTPKESERLRQVSYQRQLEAGFDDPGNAGLTAQRIGDANPFVPEAQLK